MKVKLEPMGEEEIKQLIEDRRDCFLNSCTSKDHRNFLNLILAWIHERGMTEKTNFIYATVVLFGLDHKGHDCSSDKCKQTIS